MQCAGLSRCLLAQCTVASLEGGKTAIDDTVLLQTAIKGYSMDHRTRTNLLHEPYFYFGRKFVHLDPITWSKQLFGDPVRFPGAGSSAVAEMCRDDRGQNYEDREDPSYPHIVISSYRHIIISSYRHSRSHEQTLQQLPWTRITYFWLRKQPNKS